MPKPPEMGFISFDPPLPFKSDKFNRAWDLIEEMGLLREVVFSYVGNHQIKGLGFPTKDQAMMFKLRL